MAKQLLHISDQRMLKVMEYCIANKIKDLTTIVAWCNKIGFSHTNIFNIRKGTQQFTKEHIYQVCVIFNVSSDYLFGFTNEMIRADKSISPIQRIKDAINEIESESKNNNRVEVKLKSKVS